MSAPTRGRSKSQREKKSRQRAQRGVVVLEDGLTATLRKKPAKRLRERDEDVRSREEKVLLLTADDRAYRAFGWVSDAEWTSEYPRELMSVLHALHAVFPQARELEREIRGSGTMLRAVWTGVLKHVHPDDRQYVRTLIKGGRFPDRTTVGRLYKRFGLRVEMSDSLTRVGVEVAIEADCFNAERQEKYSDPDARDQVITDGSAHKPPSDVRVDMAVDPFTGEIYQTRPDKSLGLFTEGGAEELFLAWKSVTTWVKVGGYGLAIPLALDMCKQPDPSAEADVAMNSIERIAAELARQSGDGERHVMSWVADGAPTGKHAARLAVLGAFLHNSPPAKKVEEDPDTREKIRVEEHEYPIGSVKAGKCRHSVVSRGGHAYVKTLVNGEVELLHVESKPREVRRDGRTYYYFEFCFTCPSTGERHDLRMPLHRARGEEQAAYEKRLGWMRAYSPRRGTGARLSGLTNTLENFHSRTDTNFQNGRMPRYSDATKLALLNGIMLGHALLVSARLKSGAPPGQ